MTLRRKLVGIFLTGAVALAGCGDPKPPAPSQAKGPAAQTRHAPEAEATAPPVAVAPEAPTPKPPGFRVQPATATLAPGDVGLQLLVEGHGKSGGTRDFTSAVAWTTEPEGIVAVDPDGYVRPLGPGSARVIATKDGERGVAEVTVGDPANRAWDFAADIVPIFTRAGCNTGGCHGKADGQNGFHLSLFGYDPEGDYEALTRAASGRRVLPMKPDESLLVRKATGRTPHKGGQRFAPGSSEHRTLLAWIAAGAPRSSGTTHGRILSVSVQPADTRLDEPGPRQVRVVAHFEDGHERDVTRLATYRVLDDSAASIDPNGRAILLRRAEADLVVRFESRVVTTRLATLINPDLDFDYAGLERRNFIDDELFKRLESLEVPPSPPAGDAAFLRRVTLDLTGQTPRPDQIKAFVKDTDPDKRVKVVDDLMKDRLFVKFWQIKFGDMLQISQARFNAGSGPYQKWLQDRLVSNAPWDVMVKELSTSLGDPNDLNDGGPVNYALDGEDPKVQAELTAQRFLGQRFRCAQCHDHPFDVWTQDDYYGLAAFFAKVQRGAGPAPGMMAANQVGINPDGQIEHLRTKQPASPRLPDRTTVEISKEDDPRKALSEWLTRSDNPYFATAMANWVWAQFFGKGIADPADDLSASNPPVHPELLERLAKDFVEHKYDVRHLIRTVATSEAYGLSSATVPGNEHDRRLFSHQLSRPLTAHQMADALAQATNIPNRFVLEGANGSRPIERSAVEVSDPATPSVILDTFGRCPRTVGCSAVASPQLSLRQALLLIGGDVIDSRIASLNGYLTSLLDIDTDPAGIVENLYLRTLCREPNEEELSHWVGVLESAPNLREASEDLFWALLNSREFAFNH